jgi:peptidoglycan/LPS O-acetylase OafA/YrhL
VAAGGEEGAAEGARAGGAGAARGGGGLVIDPGLTNWFVPDQTLLEGHSLFRFHKVHASIYLMHVVIICSLGHRFTDQQLIIICKQYYKIMVACVPLAALTALTAHHCSPLLNKYQYPY